MAEDMAFQMGKCPVQLPGGLRYARTHFWCRSENERQFLGFTSFAVRLMGDIYFLDLAVAAGTPVPLFGKIGHIETSKAESDLFVPIAGVVLGVNPDLLEDPSLINDDPYGAGWLLEMKGDASSLMSAADYHQYLADSWEKTQRVLKGKTNL